VVDSAAPGPVLLASRRRVKSDEAKADNGEQGVDSPLPPTQRFQFFMECTANESSSRKYSESNLCHCSGVVRGKYRVNVSKIARKNRIFQTLGVPPQPPSFKQNRSGA
jgi:hypothetical protein